jgi:hypothetical protein
MEASDVEVPGGWAVNFLFPVWPAVTEEIAARETDIATLIVGMRLDPADRLERLAALGAQMEARPHRALPDWRELGSAIGWGMLAIVSAVILVGVTLAAASLLLMGLWYVLRWVTALPRWLRGAALP